jgi:hypothetical protein
MQIVISIVYMKTYSVLKAPPVFTKDYQPIRKQGVFFRAGVARRRAIFKIRGIAPPWLSIIKQRPASVLCKIVTKVKSDLRPLFGSSIHDRFKLGFLTFKTAYILKIARHRYAKLCITVIMESKRLCKAKDYVKQRHKGGSNMAV